MKTRIGSLIMWHFDRIFGDSRMVGGQMVVIAVFLVLLIALATLVGSVLPPTRPINGAQDVLTQTVGFILSIGALTPISSTLPVWWRVVLALLGVVVFSSFAVTFFCNYVNNRVAAYRSGTVRYRFKGHLLFFGGGAMLPSMLKKVGEDPVLRRCHIVILTSDEVASVRRSIDNALNRSERRMKITVLRGNLDDAKAIQSVYAHDARRLYIIGDQPDSEDYDSVNIACWNRVRQQCSGREGVPCFLLLEHMSSSRILLRREKEPLEVLDTTIVWRPEAIAQRVLVHQGDDNPYPPLDRSGIDYDSRRTVHFVLYGMTSFAQAMAITTAQMCHFPNFLRDKALRTRITIISPDIQARSADFRSSLHHLFAMSHVVAPWIYSERVPSDDFLDVEWEFVDGTLADEEVRGKLVEYYRENREGLTYLSLALCQDEAHDNVRSALCLPDEYHDIVRKDGRVDYESTIPVFVYQPDSEELLRVASGEVPFYANLISVGSVRDSYDPSIRHRIGEAKRVNYIYSKGSAYNGMPCDTAILDQLWQTSYSNRMSSIYCASHSGVKRRSMEGQELTDALLERMARVEHNRWNVEKLLMGYTPVSATERQQLKQYESAGSAERLVALEMDLKKRKAKYEHYCIAPYDELLESMQAYDRLIVRNLNDII